MIWLATVLPMADSSCIDDAIDPSNYKYIELDGQTFPFGVFPLDWDSAWIPAHVLAHIARDVLGYHTILSSGGAYSYTGVNALAGCPEDWQETDGCIANFKESRPATYTRWHVVLEAWGNAEAPWQTWKEELPDIAPDRIGSIGYLGTEGQFIKPEVRQDALNDAGMALDWFRGFDATWRDPAAYFDKLSDFDESLLAPCLEDVSQTLLQVYAEHFDYYGVYWANATNAPSTEMVLQPNCTGGNGIWWLSPSCKHNVSLCVPYVSAPHNYGTDAIMQQAVHWNMPIAVSQAKTSDGFKAIITNHRVMTYMWEPDPFTSKVGLDEVMFNRYSRADWQDGLKITNQDTTILSKYAAGGFQLAAPDLYQLASQLNFNSADVDGWFSDLDAGVSSEQTACNWLRNNTAVWRSWIPDPTECISGQGMVDIDGNQVPNKTNAVACDWCPAGTKSVNLAEGSRTCEQCAAGKFGHQQGQTECNACALGRFSDSQGATECEECSIGTYADTTEQSACTTCVSEDRADFGRWSTWTQPAGSDKYVITSGSTSEEECGCSEGSWLTSTGTCVECTEGMECEARGVVIIQEGYYATAEEPASIWQCHTETARCPGGPPGSTCAEGREGIACSLCMPGYKEGSDGKCIPCGENGEGGAVFFCLAILGSLGLVLMYIVVDRSIRNRPNHSLLLTSIMFSITVPFVQQLAVVGIFEDVRWIEPAGTPLRGMQVVMLDMSVMNFGCVARGSPLDSFCLQVLFLVICVAILLVTHTLVTKVYYRASFISRIASLLASNVSITLAVFVAVVTAILGPFQCLRNPNGEWTMRGYESVVCWTDTGDHTAMVVVSALAVLVPLGFYAFVVWAVLVYPRKVSTGDAMYFDSFGCMFVRFKAELHWFSLAVMTRNLVLALVPMVPTAPGQICIFMIMGVAYLVLVVTARPWRLDILNPLDAFMTVSVLFMLQCASFYTERVETNSLAWLAVVMCFVCLCFLPVSIALSVGQVGKIFLREKAYKYFLCHHRAEAGAFTRLLKMHLQDRSSSTKVYVGSDSPQSLDVIFDTVSYFTETFVVVLSNDTLVQLDCVGEITTANIANLKTVKMALPDFQSPTQKRTSFIDKYKETVKDVTPLLSNGIRVQAVQDALRWFESLEAITVPAILNDNAIADILSSVVADGSLPPLITFACAPPPSTLLSAAHLRCSSSTAATMASLASDKAEEDTEEKQSEPVVIVEEMEVDNGEVKEADKVNGPAHRPNAEQSEVHEEVKTVVLVDMSNWEAVSAAMVLVHMLAQHFGHDSAERPLILPVGVGLPETVQTVLFMCSSGALLSKAREPLDAAAGRGLPILPVMIDTTFQLPPKDDFTSTFAKCGTGFNVKMSSDTALRSQAETIFQQLKPAGL